ncbi:hypothetical protein Barb6_01192 [Bacteroidales bacterium Barb6]|nr:hypothetical protein Barb6_01192 [Bacteroidales bacterium Barb6]
MRIKRAVRIGGIHKRPVPLIGHNIHSTTQSIRAKADRNNALIHLYPVGKIHRYIIYLKGRAEPFHRYTVHKEFDVTTAKPVKRKLSRRTQSARLPDSRTGNAVKGMSQIQGRIVQKSGIHSDYIVRRFANLLHGRFPYHKDFIHRAGKRHHNYVQNLILP